MVLKICYYVDYNYERAYIRFGWYLTSSDSPTCKCIMSVAEGKTIETNELNELLARRTITLEEYNAIRNFDGKDGTTDDLKTIKELAKKVKVKLVRK